MLQYLRSFDCRIQVLSRNKCPFNCFMFGTTVPRNVHLALAMNTCINLHPASVKKMVCGQIVRRNLTDGHCLPFDEGKHLMIFT